MSNKESVMGTGAKQRMAFRTVVRGYAKEDVNRYIGKMDASFRGIEQTLKNTITAQQKTIEQQAEEKEALLAMQQQQQQERDELLQTLEQCRLSLSERYAECEALRAENEALKSAPHDIGTSASDGSHLWQQKVMQLEQLLTQKEQLLAQKNREEQTISALREKAQQYDMVSQDVGKWIHSANEKAELILQNARQQAQELCDQALRQSEAMRHETEQRLQKMRTDFAQTFGMSAGKACKEAIEKLTALQKGLDRMMSREPETIVPLGEETAQDLSPEAFSENDAQ